MKTIHLTAYGNPAQNLKLVAVSEPNAPSAKEALVRMEYAPRPRPRVSCWSVLLASAPYLDDCYPRYRHPAAMTASPTVLTTKP